MTPKPPRLAEWLLDRLHRSPDARYLAGDLAEGFARRAVTDRRAARRWYWSQVLRLMRHRRGAASDAGLQPIAWRARLASTLHDVKTAGRALRRRPGPALVAVLVIGTGVAATATLFTLTYSVLYKPLPWQDADRLVRVWELRRGGTPLDLVLSNLTVGAWRESPQTVDAVEGYLEQRFVVAGPEGAEPVAGASVTPGLVSMLGATPTAGRVFAEDDTTSALVSERFRQRMYGIDGEVLGRTLALNGQTYTVVGVLPSALAFPSSNTDLWIPLDVRSAQLGSFNITRTMRTVARLRPGATPAQAAAEAQSRARSVPPADPRQQTMFFGSAGDVDVRAMPLLEFTTRESRPALLALLAGVTLLLVTAMASLAGLQLARTADRRRELVVRSALGASRGRLVALLLTEAAWVSLAGGVLAALLTRWAIAAAPALLPAGFPRLESLRFDGAATAALVALTAASAMLMSLLPAWHLGRSRLTPSAADAEPVARLPQGRLAMRTRSLVLAAQVAVAVVLLISAGLVGRTLVALVSQDLGYAPENIFVGRVIGVRADRTSRLAPDILNRAMQRLESLPGVTGAALSTALPFQNNSGRMALGFSLPGPDGQDLPASASEAMVTPSFFDLVGMRLVEGRVLDESDRRRERPNQMCVVNETFSRAYMPDQPLGPFPLGGEIVGVVQDVADPGSLEPVDAQMYCLYNITDTHAQSLATNALRGNTWIFLRSTGDPSALAGATRSILRDLDSRLGLDDVTTMDAQLAQMVARPRMTTVLAAAFAAFALVIAAVGLFGALSYDVRRRTRELGVRTALGATQRQIARTVLVGGLVPAFIGALAGLAAAAVLARFLTSLLYQVEPYDPWVFGGVPAGLLAVATLACYLPARRAAGIDPLTALRTN